MKIAVVGTGYVGLTTGACLAETGNDVICADILKDEGGSDRSAVKSPSTNQVSSALVRQNVAEGRLSFTTDVAGAVRASYIVFIAVGTPPDEDGYRRPQRGGRPPPPTSDARWTSERIVITKSTVPVGTARLVREAIEAETEHRVRVCSNPEFLKEGAALSDFRKPDRVVIWAWTIPWPGEVLRSALRTVPADRQRRSSRWTRRRRRSRSMQPTLCSRRASVS